MTTITQSAARDAAQKKAPDPKAGAKEISDMLNVVKSGRDDKDQQTVLGFVNEGIEVLTPLMMNAVLKECGYDGQRAVSERHVLVLADLMKRGQWQPKSQIDFALLNGRLILINGYHRAYAQVRSGKTIEWSVAIHRCSNDAALKSLYYAFDTNVRARNARDILKATGFADAHGMPAEAAVSLFAAIPFIASKFEINPAKKDFLAAKAVDRRLAIAAEYAKPMARYWACMEGLPASLRSRFKGGGVSAVAAITFRFQSEVAWRFWQGAMANDGLKRGDPRLALINDLMVRKTNNGRIAVFAPPIIAWNAFFNDRELRLIKVHDNFVAAIDGTPFDGKPVKVAA